MKLGPLGFGKKDLTIMKFKKTYKIASFILLAIAVSIIALGIISNVYESPQVITRDAAIVAAPSLTILGILIYYSTVIGEDVGILYSGLLEIRNILAIKRRNIDLTLDKAEYFTRETVQGTLILPRKLLDAKLIKLKAYGKEETSLKLYFFTYKYRQSNVFYSKDLLEFLNPFISSSPVSESHSNDSLRIPFEFLIPDNLIESYVGKNATVKYSVEFVEERKWRPLISKKISFTVYNHRKIPLQVNSYDQADIRADVEKNENVKIDFDGGQTYDNNNSFSPGEVIKARIIIDRSKIRKIRKIRKCEIYLKGLEHAIAYSASVIDKVTRMENYKQLIELDNKLDNIIPIEILIPQTA
jgi:hypothetical protein